MTEGTLSNNVLSLSRPAGAINIDMSSLATKQEVQAIGITSAGNQATVNNTSTDLVKSVGGTVSNGNLKITVNGVESADIPLPESYSDVNIEYDITMSADTTDAVGSNEIPNYLIYNPEGFKRIWAFKDSSGKIVFPTIQENKLEYYRSLQGDAKGRYPSIDSKSSFDINRLLPFLKDLGQKLGFADSSGHPFAVIFYSSIEVGDIFRIEFSNTYTYKEEGNGSIRTSSYLDFHGKVGETTPYTGSKIAIIFSDMTIV